MIIEILQGAGDILLAVIAWRLYFPADFIAPPAPAPPTRATVRIEGEIEAAEIQSDSEPIAAQLSDHHAEVERQERYIDRYIEWHFPDGYDTEDEKQNQRHLGLKAYNRSKR